MKQVHNISILRERFSDEGRGSIIIEFAFILPLLVILFAVIIDLGLLIREHQILQNAAREGARFSSLPQNKIDTVNPSATAEAIRDRVIYYLERENISVATADCEADPTIPKKWTCGDIIIRQSYPITIGGIVSNASEVTIAYDRSPLIPGPPFFPGGDVTLGGRAVFRNLY